MGGLIGINAPCQLFITLFEIIVDCRCRQTLLSAKRLSQAYNQSLYLLKSGATEIHFPVYSVYLATITLLILCMAVVQQSEDYTIGKRFEQIVL